MLVWIWSDRLFVFYWNSHHTTYQWLSLCGQSLGKTHSNKSMRQRKIGQERIAMQNRWQLEHSAVDCSTNSHELNSVRRESYTTENRSDKILFVHVGGSNAHFVYLAFRGTCHVFGSLAHFSMIILKITVWANGTVKNALYHIVNDCAPSFIAIVFRSASK